MSPMNLQYDHVGFNIPFHVHHVDDAKDERVEISTVFKPSRTELLELVQDLFFTETYVFYLWSKGIL